MMRHPTLQLAGAVALVLAAATLLAHEETYKGTVMAVEPAKVQVRVFDAKSKKDTPMDFAVTAKTKVLRGDRSVSFAEARIQKDERIAVTVNHDEPGHKALVIRLAARVSQEAETRGAFALDVRPVVSPAAAPSGEPQLSVSARGVLLSWIERAGARATLKFAERTATGWSAPRVVASGDDWFVNWADVPSVVRLAGGALAAHWLQKSGPGTYAYDVRLSRSGDDGNTWSPSFTPHHDGTKTEHGFASLFEMPGAGLGLVWLDGRAMAPDAPDTGGMPGGAMALRSASFDRRWQQASELTVDLRVCECCPTTVAVTSDGPIVAFRNRTEDEIRDIYVSRLEGERWTEPKPVHHDGWRINACPVNGPMLSARGRDVALAWFTMKAGQGQAFVAFSRDAGRTFTAPIRVDDGGSLGRVDVELLPDGAALPSWIEYVDDTAEFRVRRIESSGARSKAVTVAAISAARASGYPRLARHGNELVFAWTEITRDAAGLPDGTRRVKTAAARLPAAIAR